MADVRPFRALRAAPSLAPRVITPPYDVLTDREARALAADPLSFVHVTRPEVDLPDGTDPHGPTAWHKAAENLAALRASGALILDEAPRYFVYAQRMGEHHQAGFIACCSVEEYDDGRILRHELTRPDKEEDRTRHMEALNAQVGLVFLAYRSHPDLARALRETLATAALWSTLRADGVEHAFFAVPDHLEDAVRQGFAALPALYVADGHHRTAAASRVFAARRDAPSAWFIAGLFPDDHLQILAYNRVVHDLNGHTVEGLRAALAERFHLSPGEPRPGRRGRFSMYLDGAWSWLDPKEPADGDPVSRLDVSLLQDRVLAPLLGIDDPRRSERISFVGGIRGPEALAQAVDRDGGVAFHLHPTSLGELFAVADAGQIMPPKSTWFEPKLCEGVVSRLLRG